MQGPRGRYCRRFVDGANDLVVEVLAASTAAYDRGAKFAAYRKLPSLQEVLVIDSDGRRADLHREGTDGLWVLHPFEPGDAVQLRSVALDLTAAQLFAEVDARPSGAAPVQRSRFATGRALVVLDQAWPVSPGLQWLR